MLLLSSLFLIFLVYGCGGNDASKIDNNNENGDNNNSCYFYNVIIETNGGKTHGDMCTEWIADEPHTSRSGYVFEGWFDNEYFNGERLAFPYEVTKDIRLYAKWIAEYNVTFETNGGTAVEGMYVYRYGDRMEYEPHTSRSGYVFEGWFDNEYFNGERLTFPYEVTSGITLYAKWVIEIWTAADLYNVRNNLDGDYKLMADISLSDYNTGEGWLPIGAIDTAFTGNFEGNGFIIKDLYINRPDTDRVGLFGVTGNGVISNLGVEIDPRGVKGKSTVGGIVGESHVTKIRNVYSTGDISGEDIVGGIVGLAVYGNINNAYSTGNVNASKAIAGGIVGWGSSGIRNTYSTGNISAAETITATYNGIPFIGSFAGGLIGLGSVQADYSVAANKQISGPSGIGRIIGAFEYDGMPPNTSSNLALDTMSANGASFTGNIIHDGADVSLSQLHSKATYEALGWDFDNIWTIDEGKSMPTFQFQK